MRRPEVSPPRLKLRAYDEARAITNVTIKPSYVKKSSSASSWRRSGKWTLSAPASSGEQWVGISEGSVGRPMGDKRITEFPRPNPSRLRPRGASPQTLSSQFNPIDQFWLTLWGFSIFPEISPAGNSARRKRPCGIGTPR